MSAARGSERETEARIAADAGAQGIQRPRNCSHSRKRLHIRNAKGKTDCGKWPRGSIMQLDVPRFGCRGVSMNYPTGRAAIYARYSTDRQSTTSIDDQVRKCRQYAGAHGLEIAEDQVYADQAISGVGADRAELRRMLDRALSPAPPFEVILVDDTSRLSRTTEDALTIFKRLNFAGVKLIAVSQGISSDHEQSEMLVTVHGLVDSLYVREPAKKTHRGLEGTVLRGCHYA